MKMAPLMADWLLMWSMTAARMLRFRCTTSTYISTISDSDLIGTC